MYDTEREVARFKHVVRKFLSWIPPQTVQDHVNVRVVSWVLDGHVLEKSEICSEDLICPGLEFSSMPPHAPCAPILKPWLTPWEEVKAHVFYTRHRELVCNELNPCCAFWLPDIIIEVVCHQDISPVRSIPNGRSDILYV